MKCGWANEHLPERYVHRYGWGSSVCSWRVDKGCYHWRSEDFIKQGYTKCYDGNGWCLYGEYGARVEFMYCAGGYNGSKRGARLCLWAMNRKRGGFLSG